MTLNETEPGQTVRVLTLGPDGSLQHRLRALGMIPGTTVTVLLKKRSGTLVLSLRGTRFALGSRLCAGIGVEHV